MPVFKRNFHRILSYRSKMGYNLGGFCPGGGALTSYGTCMTSVCDSAECEARRLQREREREDELQQRLRRHDDKQRRLYTSTQQRLELSASETSVPTGSQSTPSHATTNATPDSTHQPSSVNHNSSASSTPARAPTLRQAAGCFHNY